MATCEFAGGVKNVRGTICRTVYYVDGVKHTKSVVAKVTRTGKQKLYIRDSSDYRRTTPVSKDELVRRNKFADANRTVAKLTEDEKRAYAQAMKKAKNRYNGKEYKMLRGYILARLYNNDPI